MLHELMISIYFEQCKYTQTNYQDMNFDCMHNLVFSGGKIGVNIDNTQTRVDNWIVTTDDEHKLSQVRL